MREGSRFMILDELDQPILMLVPTLWVIGMIAMGSASMDFAAERYGNPFYHVYRHAVYLGLGMVAMWFCTRVPMRVWEELGGLMLAIALVFLIIVLIPGLGRTVNGSSRWIGFGPLTLQASELAKFCFLIYVAGYAVRRENELAERWLGIVPVLGVLGMILVLLLLEPDFGAAVVLSAATLGMLFFAGTKLLPFSLVVMVAAAGTGFLALTSPYRLQRLVAFLDPWANQFDSGYQLTQALIAFGRGGWTGVGLGNSVQKLFYLPEAHTDFVFAILAEELGLVGAAIVLSLFAALIWRMLFLSRLAALRKQQFASVLAFGIALLFACQVIINIGVNTGVLPTKGLTLPFLSYGGTSLLMHCALIGLILRVNQELCDRGARSTAVRQ